MLSLTTLRWPDVRRQFFVTNPGLVPGFCFSTLTLAASLRARSAGSWGMTDRPHKITLADMRDMGVRGVLSRH
jgi:hypothetical protein